MSVPTKALTVTVYDHAGVPVQGAIVTAKLTAFDVYQNQYVLPIEQQATTNASGVATLNLFPNVLGQKNTQYQVKATSADGATTYINTTIRMPDLAKNLDELDGSSSATPDNTGISHGYRNVPFADQLGRFLSLMVNFNTAARQYVFPDKSGTVIVGEASLTPGRVPFVDASGGLTDDPDLTFNGTTLAAAAAAIAGLLTAATLTVAGALSAGSLSAPTISATTVSATTISASGQFLAANGSAAAPAYSFSAAPSTGLFNSGGAIVMSAGGVEALNIGVSAGVGIIDIKGSGPGNRFVIAGGNDFYLSTTQMALKSGHVLQWSSTSNATAAGDLFLMRDAANTLAQRNGTSGQAFNVYSTFTDASNYIRGVVKGTGGVIELGSEVAGTGVGQGWVRIKSGGNGGNTIVFQPSGAVSDAWGFNASGHFLAITDNTYDLGAPASRPRSIYWGTKALAPDGSASAPAYSFVTSVSGLFLNGGNPAVSNSNNMICQWSPNGYQTDRSIEFAYGTGATLIGDASDVLAQRRGVNAQAFRLYNTFTDAANYERVKFAWDLNVCYLKVENAGTGTARHLVLDAGSELYLRRAGAGGWKIISGSHLVAESDNTADIGASGANRPRTGYFGTSVVLGSATLAAAGPVNGTGFRVGPTSGNLDSAVQLNSSGTAVTNWLEFANAGTTVGFCQIVGSLWLSNFNGYTFRRFSDNSTSFSISPTATAVNYLDVASAVTGNGPRLDAVGTDANIEMSFFTTGTGAFRFLTNRAAPIEQFRVAHTANAVNYLQATGGATGAPGVVTLSAQGTDANVNIALTPKGTGVLKSGSDIVALLAAAQILTNKTLDASVAKGVWTASGTWTIPAVTLGGTVSGGGNQINNVVIGASTPLAGSFTTLSTTGDLTIGGASMPQNSQSAAYTLVAADANKHILHPTADNNARTFTIPANASVAFAVGTCVTFVNQINTVTIAITTDTLVLAGTGATGSRTLAASGVATAVKIASTTWLISGTGLT